MQRLQGEARAQTLRAFGARWRPIGWSALGIAIVTGAVIAGRANAFDATPTRFDVTLAIKGVLVGLLVAGAYLHDYVLGPGAPRGRSAKGSRSRCAGSSPRSAAANLLFT